MCVSCCPARGRGPAVGHVRPGSPSLPVGSSTGSVPARETTMATYGQFCPVAKAMEILDERWTLLVVRELLAGSTRFNEIRRGVPKMSPALLAKRLRSLERAGVVRRSE